MKEIKGVQVFETLEEVVDPKHTALLVIDVQNDNASPKGFMASMGADISWITKIISPIKTVLQKTRQLGLLTIFIRIVFTRDGTYQSGPRLRMYNKNPLGRDASDWIKMNIEGTWGSEVFEGLVTCPHWRYHLLSSYYS